MRKGQLVKPSQHDRSRVSKWASLIGEVPGPKYPEELRSIRDLDRANWSSLLMPELVRIAKSLGIPGAGRMRKSQLAEAIAARTEPNSAPEDWNRLVNPAILDSIYATDQGLVASSIMAIRRGAEEMIGQRAQDLDIFGSEGAEELGDRWDVLQNYAEQNFPNSHPVFGDQRYDRTIIDASYDPAWRRGLGEWEEQNKELVVDNEPTYLPAFDHAAELDLEGYANDFYESPMTLEALNAGRLPIPLRLIVSIT